MVLAGALALAHGQGVVHRDVKPRNVMLDRDGEPVLVDFGIAAFASDGTTTHGSVTASVAFAAPEVLDGARATSASDVYSLGATLLAALLGHPPFADRADVPLSTLLARIATQPVADLRPNGVPERLWSAICAAMAKDPADRPESMTDLRAVIAGGAPAPRPAAPVEATAAVGRPTATRPARRRRTVWRAGLALGAVAAVATTVAVTVASWGTTGAASTSAVSAPTASDRRLATPLSAAPAVATSAAGGSAAAPAGSTPPVAGSGATSGADPAGPGGPAGTPWTRGTASRSSGGSSAGGGGTGAPSSVPGGGSNRTSASSAPASPASPGAQAAPMASLGGTYRCEFTAQVGHPTAPPSSCGPITADWAAAPNPYWNCLGDLRIDSASNPNANSAADGSDCNGNGITFTGDPQAATAGATYVYSYAIRLESAGGAGAWSTARDHFVVHYVS